MELPDDGPVARTVTAYDQIAASYLAQWRDRRVVERPLALFSGLLPAGALVLDLGCGPGFDGEILRERGFRVIGLDLSWEMLCVGTSNYPGIYLHGDMRRLPLATGALQGVWASASLLHLPRPMLVPALREVRRALNSGGLFYFSVKEGTGEAWQTDACGREAPRYFTYWQENELDACLNAAGLAAVAGWREAGERNVWLSRVVRKIREIGTSED